MSRSANGIGGLIEAASQVTEERDVVTTERNDYIAKRWSVKHQATKHKSNTQKGRLT